MMEFDEIVVKESPGLCRCCLSEGCYKELGTEYTWMNETEVYADMLLECFDISISQHNDGPNGPNRLICEVCITRLRDACNFKKQVLNTEKKFIDLVAKGDFKNKVLVYQPPTKAENDVVDDVEEAEVEYLEEDMDFLDDTQKVDDSIEATVSEDITVAPLPVKLKRGRPRKNPEAKPEKKAKIMKLDEKPRTSKAVIKDFKEDDKLVEKRRKDELTRLLTVIIENSTIMPFRWASSKYMCFYCCCPFVDSSKLKEHTKIEHHEVKLKNVLRTLVGTRSVKLDISEIKCKKCPKPLKDLEEFLKHASEAHDLAFNKDMTNYLYSYKLSDDKMCCLECGSNFNFFGPLLTHMHKFHGKTKSHLCEICGQAFIARANVESHIRNVHSNVRNQCSNCKMVFQTQHALMKHYDNVHMLNKLKCPKCPEVLPSRYLKKRHLALVHDLESAQFNCDECAKVFTYKNKLIQHKSRVHLKEKPVTCDICGFKVFNNENLKRHMVKHDDARPYQCEFCKKSFQRKKTLDYHRRIHTNDRRYVCKECGRAFVQVTSLKLHLRVHHSSNESGSWTLSDA